jgi:hypothetical protein
LNQQANVHLIKDVVLNQLCMNKGGLCNVIVIHRLSMSAVVWKWCHIRGAELIIF